MRRLWFPLLILYCVSSSSNSAAGENDSKSTNVRVKRSSSEKRVVCYYTNWSVYRPGTAKFTPQNINPYLCTHLIYAFGGLDKENGLRPFDKYQDVEQGGYAKFTGLKTYNKNLKTLLAIGGWNEGSTRFSPLVADEDRRKEFVKNVLKFLRVNHFDGLDLDWEYPAFRDGGKSADRDNYAQLVQELREEFERESAKTGRPRLLLTMAVPAGIEYIDKGYDVKKLNDYLDFMNILSYDYHSAFEPAVNHHSPLYPLEEDGEYNFEAPLSIDHTIKHYLKSGADANKLVLGIPTYGRSYTLFNSESNQIGAPADGPGEQGDATREKGYLAYYEICSSLMSSDEWNVEHPNPRAMGPYAYKGNQWVGYDDQQIAKDKANYVNEKNLGGIMFWSIDNDDFRGTCHGRPYPIIEAAKEALFGINSELPSSSKTPKDNKESKLSTSTKRTRPKSTPSKASSSKTTTTPSSLTTPEPPTTPDPGSDFKCKDEGFFPHPRDCKKYFWCLDSGPSNLGIVAHQFTCPSGLFFNKAADSCDFARNVLCKIKSTPAPSKAPITLATAKTTFNRKEPSTPSTSTTTTTTTTTEPPPEEEEVEDEAEDPQTIKQLIDLIKKLGGVDELEKQLNQKDAPISRSLYDKVIANTGKSRFQSRQQNGPGPQNQGLQFTEDEATSSSKERPKYKTIQRERPSTTKSPIDEDDEETLRDDNDNTVSSTTQASKYSSIFRRRQSTPPTPAQDETEPEIDRPVTPKYVTLARSRPSAIAPVTEEPEEDTQEVTQRYVTLKRPKPKVVTTSPTLDDSPSEQQRLDSSATYSENNANAGRDDDDDDRASTDFETQSPKIFGSSTTTSTTTSTTPRAKVRLYIVTPATDPVASVYRTSTWTSIVTSIMEDALTQRTKVKLNHTEESGRAMDGIFNKSDNRSSSTPDVSSSTTSPSSSKDTLATDEVYTTLSTTPYSTVDTQTTNATISPDVSSLRLPLRKPTNTSSRFLTFNRNRSSSPNVLTTTTTTTKTTDAESKNKYSRFKTKSKSDSDSSTKKYVSLNRLTTTTTPSSSSTESLESVEPSSSTRKYFNRFRSSTTSSTEDKSVSEDDSKETKTSSEGLVTSKYKYILRTRPTTTSKDSLTNEVTKDQNIEQRIQEILETQEQNEDGQVYDNEVDNNVTPSANVKYTRPLITIRRSSIVAEDTKESSGKFVRSTTISTATEPSGSTRRFLFRSTTTAPPPSSSASTEIVSNEIKANRKTIDLRHRGQSKYKPNKGVQKIDSNEYEGEIDDGQTINSIQSSKNKNRVIEVRIRKKARNPKQLNGTSSESSSSESSQNFYSNEQFSTNTENGLSTTVSSFGDISGESTTTDENSYDETTVDYGRDTFLTTFLPTTEQTVVFNNILNRIGTIVQNASKENTVQSADIINENEKLTSTEFYDKVTEDYDQISTIETQTEASRLATSYTITTTKPNFFSRGTKYYETYTTSSPLNELKKTSPSSTTKVVNNPENSRRKTNVYENSRRRTTTIESEASTKRLQTKDSEAYLNRNGIRNRSDENNDLKNKFGLSNDLELGVDSNQKNRDSINQINTRRKTSRYTSTTLAPIIKSEGSLQRRKSNITRNRGSVKAYTNPDVLKEIDYEDKSTSRKDNFLNGQFFVEVSTASLNRRRYRPSVLDTSTPFVAQVTSQRQQELLPSKQRFTSRDRLGEENFESLSKQRFTSRDKLAEENFLREESIYFPLKKSTNEEKTNFGGETKLSRPRVSFRRPAISRSTTTSSTTESSPVVRPSSPRAVFRRRKLPSSTSTSAPSTLAQEVNSLPDITTSRSRKFEFPRRTSNSLPEPEALQGADYDTGASEELPELANMAVVAIHNLATIPPQPFTTASSTALTTTEKLRKTPLPRQPINIFSQNQETQQSTPILRSQLSNGPFLPSSSTSGQDVSQNTFRPVPDLREYTPTLRQSTPIHQSDFSLNPVSAPIPAVFKTQSELSTPIIKPPSLRSQTVQRKYNNLRSESTPILKEKPFSKKLPSSPSQYDYAEDEVYGIEPIEIPLSGKVRIHTDGYIECLDMGNFPHPFSCKKFISCAKMENGLQGSLLGWEYTCPKGLSFDPIGGICNWSAGLGCKE